MQTFSRAAAFFNTFVNPIGLANIGWKYYIVYTVWLAVEGVVVYLGFPETKGKSLEELAWMFEGEEKSREQEKRVEMQMEVGEGGRDGEAKSQGEERVERVGEKV